MIDDGHRFDFGSDRLEFPNDQTAAREAQRALADMANENLPDGPHFDVHISVENEAGEVVYQASLEFNGQTGQEMRSKAAQTDRPSMNGSHRPRKDG